MSLTNSGTLLHIPRCDVDCYHEAIGALVLESFISDPIGLYLIGHQDEPIISGCAEVPQVLDNDWIGCHAWVAHQRQFAVFAAIKPSFSTVLGGLPVHCRICRRHCERFPLEWIDVAENDR